MLRLYSEQTEKNTSITPSTIRQSRQPTQDCGCDLRPSSCRVHSDQREHRRRLWIRVQPNVHNADLRLRHTMWRIDHRLKRNSLLDDVLVATLRRNAGDVLVCRRKLDAYSGERIQRLQQIVFSVAGKRVKSVKEPRPRHALVFQKWNRELADTEVPVRMPCPFHFKIVTQIEGQLNTLADDLIDDHPVVDALHPNLPAVFPVIQRSSLLLQIEYVDGF